MHARLPEQAAQWPADHAGAVLDLHDLHYLMEAVALGPDNPLNDHVVGGLVIHTQDQHAAMHLTAQPTT